MQKVITVTTHTNMFENKPKDLNFVENEYPVLDKYLAEGYKISQIITVEPKNAHTCIIYSLTFVLEKEDKE